MSAFPLPGAMDKDQRCELESLLLGAFNVLIGMEDYGGRYVSITPGHPVRTHGILHRSVWSKGGLLRNRPVVFGGIDLK